MRQLLRHLRARQLNLDLDDKEYGDEGIDNAPLSARELWRLMRFLFRQSLCDGAAAVQLCCDESGCHMRYHVKGTWYEMVPAPPTIKRQAIKALRKKSRITRGRQEGELLYIRDGSLVLAHCVSPSADALCIYYAEARPAPTRPRSGARIRLMTQAGGQA